MNIRLNAAAILAVGTLALTGPAAHAEDQSDGLWHGNISIGGGAATGNRSTRTLAINGDTAKATEADKLSLSTLLNYGQSSEAGVRTTTADLLRLGGRYDFNLGAQAFSFGGAEAETNKAAGVSERYNLNGGLGYKLVRSDDTSFDVFGGLSYSGSKFTNGSRRQGAATMFGEESSHQLSATTRFKQRLVLYPGGGSVGSRATFDASLATAIAGGWTMNAGLATRYVSKVPEGTRKADSLLTFGFGYKY